MSQTQKILNHLKQGKGITPLYALKKFGCFRLAARIRDLRSQGYNIITEINIEREKQFARYKLIEK